jgi:hypothetical protein
MKKENLSKSRKISLKAWHFDFKKETEHKHNIISKLIDTLFPSRQDESTNRFLVFHMPARYWDKCWKKD